MIDTTDRKIIAALLDDARISLRELAQRVGLSPPSVSERLRRLEERGVIQGYAARVDPRALGYAMQALVRLRPLPGKNEALQRLLRGMPEIAECDKVTGEDCYVIRLFLRSIEQLDAIVDRIAILAECNSSIVKSQLITRRPPPLRPAGA